MKKITNPSDTVLIDPNEPLILPDGTALVGRIEWFLYALCCLDYQNLPTPMSRIEEFANALITGEIPNIEPQSRAEQFFLAILDGNVSNLPQPQSRSEILLDKLARGEFDLSDVEPIQSRYELLLAYLIKNGGIGNIDYVLYEFSEAMKTMYNTVEKPFKSLELSGNTLVNCVLEDTENDDYTSFDKDYSGTSFTINGTSEGAIKSAILSGKTLVNLVNDVTSNEVGNYNNSHCKINVIRNLQNETLTIIFNVTSLEIPDGADGILRIGGGWSGQIRHNPTLGINKVLYNYNQTSNSWLGVFSNSEAYNLGQRITISDVMVLEGDYTNVDIPYFEDMQSVKLPVLKTTGKNLFDMNRPYDAITDSQATVVQDTNQITVSSADSGTYVSANFILDKDFFAGKTVIGSCLYESDIKDMGTVQISYQDGNGDHHYQWIKTPKTFTFPNNFIGDVVLCVCANNTGTPQSNTVTVKNIQLELGSVATSYEPHKSNILTTTSKNLFDMNRPYDAITDSQATVVQDTNQITVSSAESGIYVNANFILDKDFFAGKTVTGSCLYESDEKDIGTVQIHYQDGDGEHHYQWIRTPRTFTFPNSFIGDVMLSVSANNTDTPQSNTVTVKNIQLELGSTATSYEPYSQGVTLRGIGDVKDELNLLTGEVTQNIYQITLTGDESGYGYSTAPSVDTDFHGTLNIRSANLPLNKKLVAPISDRFQGALYGANKTWQCCIGGSYALHFFIPKTELETSDINGFKNWVKQQYLNGNPIKVAYILEEKSIKTVDLNVVDQNNIKIDKIHVFDGTTHVNASSDELTPTVNIGKSVSYPTIIKPNTKYTVDLKRNDKPLTVNLGGTEVTFVDGETRKVITTPSTLTNDKLSYYGVGAKCNEIMLIEGEVEGNVDYFTGMQSVVMQNQMPILCTVGKNLFKYEGTINTKKGVMITFNNSQIDFSGNYTSDNLWNTHNLSTPITLRKGNYYYNLIGNGTQETVYFSTSDGTKLHTGRWTLDTDIKLSNIHIGLQQGKIYDGVTFKLQIEQGSTATECEPYKSSILSCNEDVVLREIGDVRDTLDLMTGEVTERVGEIVLDGSQDVNSWWNTTSTIGVGTPIPTMKNISKLNCDKLPVVSHEAMNNDTYDKDGVASWDNGNIIRFRIEKSKLSTEDVNGVKQYLQSNPITIQYELINKSVKTVDLSVVDQDGNTIPKIKSYEDVTHLEVTVPKQSLLPNVSAEVATDNSKDMSSLTIKYQEISEAQATIQDNIQSQSDEIDTALMATTEIFESILE